MRILSLLNCGLSERQALGLRIKVQNSKIVRVVRYVTCPFNPSSMPHAATTNKGAAACMVIWYVTDPFNLSSMPHVATTNKDAVACKSYMVCNTPL